MKTPFVTKDQLEAAAAQYPTPFHIYDEKGIRENARRLKAAFAWNPGFREYFAVKATPTRLRLLVSGGAGPGGALRDHRGGGDHVLLQQHHGGGVPGRPAPGGDHQSG